MSYTISIEGMDRLMATLNRAAQDKLDEIELEIEAAAIEIVDIAKQRVPKNLGGLANSITPKKISKANWEIVVQKFYAPYIEFGTGQRAAAYLSSLDSELQAYAYTFYVSGNGRLAPQPFIFPALEQVRGRLIERIKNILIA